MMRPDETLHALEMAIYAEQDERGSMAVIGMSLCAFSGFIVGVIAGWLI